MQYSSAHGSLLPYCSEGRRRFWPFLGRTARCAWNTLSCPAIFFSIVLARSRVLYCFFLPERLAALLMSVTMSYILTV